MAAYYDHFRVVFENQDGTEDEIEGGWTGEPKGLEGDTRKEWFKAYAISWGMPETSRIIRFSLCG